MKAAPTGHPDNQGIAALFKELAAFEFKEMQQKFKGAHSLAYGACANRDVGLVTPLLTWTGHGASLGSA